MLLYVAPSVHSQSKCSPTRMKRERRLAEKGKCELLPMHVQDYLITARRKAKRKKPAKEHSERATNNMQWPTSLHCCRCYRSLSACLPQRRVGHGITNRSSRRGRAEAIRSQRRNHRRLQIWTTRTRQTRNDRSARNGSPQELRRATSTARASRCTSPLFLCGRCARGQKPAGTRLGRQRTAAMHKLKLPS